MVKKLIKKWLGLTELEKEYQDYSFLKDFEEYITTRVDELEYDVRYLEKLEKQYGKVDLRRDCDKSEMGTKGDTSMYPDMPTSKLKLNLA